MTKYKLNHLHSIDLLRGIASLLVCIFHFTNFEYNNELIFRANSAVTNLGELGSNGVYIFFVISGCVIPYALYKSQFKFNHFLSYIWRRFIRIEIPYIVSIALILAVLFIFSIYNNTYFNFEIYRLIYHIIYFIPFSDYEWYNAIYWTLAIEFQFYILIGILFSLLMHHSMMIKMAMLVIFIVLGIIFTNSHLIFYYTPIFLLGMLTFLKVVEKIENYLFYTFLVVGVLIIAYFHSISISIFSIGTLVAILTLKREMKLGKWLGKISYSLYLTHGLIGGNFLYFTVRYVHSEINLLLLVVLAIVFSIIFAVIFNKYVEEPSRKLSKKFKKIK